MAPECHCEFQILYSFFMPALAFSKLAPDTILPSSLASPVLLGSLPYSSYFQVA